MFNHGEDCRNKTQNTNLEGKTSDLPLIKQTIITLADVETPRLCNLISLLYHLITPQKLDTLELHQNIAVRSLENKNSLLSLENDFMVTSHLKVIG